jgi:3-isopropylmalate dehydrogenase
LAGILAGALMLDTLGQCAAAKAIEDAVVKTLPNLKSLGAGSMGYSTSEVGDMVVRNLESGSSLR